MNINKIIRTLDLSKSDARDKTIQGIIEYILYAVNENVTIENILEYIKMDLNIELYKPELLEGLETLITAGLVKKDSGSKYSLTDDSKLNLRKFELQNEAAKRKRFEQFSDSIVKYSSKPLSKEDIELLWSNLTEYIYECYLEHGKSALNAFSSKAGY